MILARDYSALSFSRPALLRSRLCHEINGSKLFMSDQTQSAVLSGMIRTPRPKAKVGSRQWAFSKSGILCGLVVVACVLACRANVEAGYLDDWSTARTAQVL